MLDELRAMVVFAETVDAGSMSAAARRLGMSASAVSQTIRTPVRRTGVSRPPRHPDHTSRTGCAPLAGDGARRR